MTEKDEVSFEVVTDAEVPDRADVNETQMHDAVKSAVDRAEARKQEMKDRGIAGAERKGTLAPEMPKALFSIVAGFIDCQKFNLDDTQAKIYADSLNVLFPVEGKIVAVLNLLIITAGKCVTCYDAIKRKFAGAPKDELIPAEQKKDLPEQLQ